MVQQVAREAFKNLVESLLFINAFPHRGKRTEFAKNAIFKAATDLKQRAVAKRMNKDTAYGNLFATLVSPERYQL